MTFIKNKLYKRKELHDEYGGNRQSGICPSSVQPIIFIFSGNSGGQYGYEDGWDNENIFRYSGEGQIGDMEFTRGNKSILNHKEDGKNIYLFEKTQQSGYWKFIDELVYVSYDYYPTTDREGNKRSGIKFNLIRTTEIEKYQNISNTTIKEFKYSEPNVTERKGMVTSRVGQGLYREKIIKKWNKTCPITKCKILTILISSHIKSWKESDSQERLDVENGILLSPNVDSLFDKHLISFSDSGEMLLSDKISNDVLNKLGIDKNVTLTISDGMKKYLKRHREIFHK